jgi:ribosome-associated protein
MTDPQPSTESQRPMQPQESDDRPRHLKDDAQTRQFVIEAARLLNDLHCQDIVALDVRGLSPVTDYIVIASGTSDRQIRSVGDNVEDLAQQYGFSRYGRETDGKTTWVVVDFVDVVCHLFEPATRGHYDLEMMWGDAKPIAWRR